MMTCWNDHTADEDFATLENVSRTFEPRPTDSTSHIRCVNINVTEDRAPEVNEMFSVELSTSDTGVNLNQPSSSVTIVNDDGRPEC